MEFQDKTLLSHQSSQARAQFTSPNWDTFSILDTLWPMWDMLRIYDKLLFMLGVYIRNCISQRFIVLEFCVRLQSYYTQREKDIANAANTIPVCDFK